MCFTLWRVGRAWLNLRMHMGHEIVCKANACQVIPFIERVHDYRIVAFTDGIKQGKVTWRVGPGQQGGVGVPSCPFERDTIPLRKPEDRPARLPQINEAPFHTNQHRCDSGDGAQNVIQAVKTDHRLGHLK